MQLSSNNIIHSNTIQKNEEGIILWHTNKSIVYNCIIQNNSYGIWPEFSNINNKIFFNNFINNTHHIYAFGSIMWTTTHNIKYTYQGNIYTNQLGNYWDNYTGIDNNNDGIGETPYGNDAKPLTQPTWNYKIYDTDKDGLNDVQEEAYGTDPANNDTDDDGLLDEDEVNVYNTDPTNSDTDGDGMPDG